MNNYRFSKIIDVGGNRYSLTVSNSHEAIFKLVRGFHKNGGEINLYDAFGSDTSPIEIFNVKNSIRCFRAVLKEFENYLYEYNPPMLNFGAYEKSRIKLYKRACSRIEKTGKYTAVWTDDGYFLLIRN